MATPNDNAQPCTRRLMLVIDVEQDHVAAVRERLHELAVRLTADNSHCAHWSEFFDLSQDAGDYVCRVAAGAQVYGPSERPQRPVPARQRPKHQQRTIAVLALAEHLRRGGEVTTAGLAQQAGISRRTAQRWLKMVVTVQSAMERAA